jgi:hypothetical protein
VFKYVAAHFGYPDTLTAAPLEPARPFAPGLPFEEKKRRKISPNLTFLVFDPIFILLFNKDNDYGYLRGGQQAQKDLEDPLHHGDPQDQKHQGYQQVQVHPKRGNDTEELGNSKSLSLGHQILENLFRIAIIYLAWFIIKWLPSLPLSFGLLSLSFCLSVLTSLRPFYKG